MVCFLVSVINGTTNTKIKDIAVGLNPIDIAANPSTGILYIVNAGFEKYRLEIIAPTSSNIKG